MRAKGLNWQPSTSGPAANAVLRNYYAPGTPVFYNLQNHHPGIIPARV